MSLYQLTIEDGTAFADRFRAGGLLGLPGEDLSADLYLVTQELCESAGIRDYEVSNYCVPGEECRHNLVYWNSGDYVGVGPGAHGRIGVKRSRFATECFRLPNDWLSYVAAGCGEVVREELSDTDVSRETVLMGLRLSDGLRKTELTQHIPTHAIDRAINLELLYEISGHIRTSLKGRLLLNSLTDLLLNV